MLTRYVEHDVLPTAQRHGMGLLTYSPIGAGWLSGRWRKSVVDLAPSSPARKQLTARFDLSLIELAFAFVLSHPAVTSAIIGPRTVDQLVSQLRAADVVLSPELLDRIDEIVPLGVAINPADTGYQTRPGSGDDDNPAAELADPHASSNAQ